MNKDEALKMAIDEIQDLMQHIKARQPDMLFTGAEYVINACKEAIATNEESLLVQPSQGIELEWYNKGWDDAKKEFIGLTDDEVQDVFNLGHKTFKEFARAIEQAFRIKNDK